MELGDVPTCKIKEKPSTFRFWYFLRTGDSHKNASLDSVKKTTFVGGIYIKSVKVITSKNQQKVENFQIPARFWETNLVPSYKPPGGSPAILEMPESIPEPKKSDILFLGVKYLLSISVSYASAIVRTFDAETPQQTFTQ